jgi:hypothetical protein
MGAFSYFAGHFHVRRRRKLYISRAAFGSKYCRGSNSYPPLRATLDAIDKITVHNVVDKLIWARGPRAKFAGRKNISKDFPFHRNVASGLTIDEITQRQYRSAAELTSEIEAVRAPFGIASRKRRHDDAGRTCAGYQV